MRLIAFVVVASLGATAVCLAQDTARMDQVVQSYVSNGTFAGSVLVARGSDVIVSKGYGLANVEWDVPSTPSARFKIASISKQFTAAAILLLEERGRLKIDDLVKTYLPDAPLTWDRITLFHLLTHTAGFPGLQSPPTGRQPPVESADGTVAGFVAALMQRPLESLPGERFNYTNSGYLILGHLIQKLTGQSYETFIRENIFTPLGMKDSGLDSLGVIARRAGSYTVTRNGLVNSSYASDRVVPNTSAGLYSTTEDLLRWQNALYGGKVLSQVSLDKMTRPFKDDYGLGVYIRTIDGRRAATHGGGTPPFANLTYFFDRGISVVVLGNLSVAPSAEIAGYLGALAHGDTVQLMSEKKAITLAPSVLARYAGVYQFAGRTMTIRVEGGQLAAQPGGGTALPLLAESETRFFNRDINVVVEFVRDGAGNVAELVVLQGTHQERATRVK